MFSSSSLLAATALLGCIASSAAFAPTGLTLRVPSRSAVTSLSMSGKLNKKIELDNKKVVTNVELAEGDKKVMCRCWLSGTFPQCDGSHNKHNEDTGDNVGPLIVAVPKK